MTDQKTETEAETPTSWREKTLKAAGYSYIVGDGGMIAAGLLRGGAGWKEVVGGAATWFAGGVAAAHFGNPGIEHQLLIQAGKLESYLRKHGVVIPEDAREQNALLANKSVWKKAEQFMYEHPSEMLNGMYAIGALLLLHKGVTGDFAKGSTLYPHGLNKEAFKNVSTDFWVGLLVAAGSLTGLFVKEDPDAMKKAEHGNLIERAMAYVKEKPLRASAAFYVLNNLILGGKVWQDWDDRSKYAGPLKPHYASGLQLAAYVFSNIMLFLSPRDQITQKGFAAGDLVKLEDAAARVIAAQSPETQKALLADVSQFMATQKGVNLRADVIETDLANRIVALTKDRLTPSWSAREEARPSAEAASVRV